MTKQEAKNIAMVLIARTAVCFDGTAFDACEPELSETDINKIVKEIELISQSMIKKIEKKLDVNFNNAFSTHEIVDVILYEQ